MVTITKFADATLFAVLVMLVFASAPAAEARMAKPVGSAAGPAHPVKTQGVKTTPLSKPQCTGLGGKVLGTSLFVCFSGYACVTTDSNHVMHHACINE